VPTEEDHFDGFYSSGLRRLRVQLRDPPTYLTLYCTLPPRAESETTGDISTAENCKQKTCLLLYSPSHHKTFIIITFFPDFLSYPVFEIGTWISTYCC